MQSTARRACLGPGFLPDVNTMSGTKRNTGGTVLRVWAECLTLGFRRKVLLEVRVQGQAASWGHLSSERGHEGGRGCIRMKWCTDHQHGPQDFALWDLLRSPVDRDPTNVLP